MMEDVKKKKTEEEKISLRSFLIIVHRDKN